MISAQHIYQRDSCLTEEQKEQLDEYLGEDPPTPDFNIPGNEIFRYLFNKDTCRRVLEDLTAVSLVNDYQIKTPG